ncbi:MAG: NADPH-dependent FMN reductase, partial [Saezia sp.]
MSSYKLAFVVGSLRQESYNKALAQAVAKLFPAEFQIDFVEIGNLPLYNQDKENEPNAEVQKFRQHIKEAHAVVFFTPE